MVNPSSSGWINKFFKIQKNLPTSDSIKTSSFYQSVRDTGFIYGYTTRIDIDCELDIQGWTVEEISKVALLNTLYKLFVQVQMENDPDLFIEIALKFYEEMHPEGKGYLQRFLPVDSKSKRLEKIIGIRVLTNHSIFSKSFSHILTNTLLYMDVLAFRQYLLYGEIPSKYLKRLEEVVTHIATNALGVKTKKTNYDELLIKMFQSSVRFSKFNDDMNNSTFELDSNYFNSVLERYYFLDIAAMCMWSDEKLDQNEVTYVFEFAQTLHIDSIQTSETLDFINAFILRYKNEIPYFKFSNPVKHFYDQMTSNVLLLLSRNKTRLLNEVLESGELVKLLALSTQRDLSRQEKKKIRKQLLDICKTIPSLAIFILPGGSLLLPILIKFIPTLLPSAFNENLNDTE
ncbi:MAG: hypothetical protein KBS98_00265 [Flavobacterium sp.]|nr:hypothetical protein [Candidatus Neoflavobacterium equi]